MPEFTRGPVSVMFSLAVLFFGPTTHAATCTTTIRCDTGTATCTIEAKEPPLINGRCGHIEESYRACYGTTSEGRYSERHYICCSREGEAFVFSNRTLAERLCASIGTVQ